MRRGGMGGSSGWAGRWRRLREVRRGMPGRGEGRDEGMYWGEGMRRGGERAVDMLRELLGGGARKGMEGTGAL